MNFFTEIFRFFPQKILDFIKTKTKDIELSSFCTYNNNVPQHLSKGEYDALKITLVPLTFVLICF